MRRILILIMTILLLWGCQTRQPEPAGITVSLSLPEGCSVLENGLQIQSGEDAVFRMILEEGYEFSSVDYDGDYTIENKQGVLHLRLQGVRYATLAPVHLACSYCTVTYQPNGGQGSAQTVVYNIEEHIRPNTSIGTDIFSRDGYTLTGWNTEPDGSGISVGLGSRVSVPDGKLTLYAQWAPWTPAEQFTYLLTQEGIRITGYLGGADTVVVPATMVGYDVTAIGKKAFDHCTAESIILPPTIKTLEEGAFTRCALRELTFFDTIENFADVSFVDCPEFSTVHINAVEAPWGYDYRRESCLADKVDLLIEARGQQKIVFYGGCSMWYNLDGQVAQEALPNYRVINLALNGVMNSSAQMQILTAFMEEGDIFFHTPEVSSDPQMMIRRQMINHDRKLWCGMEYNYDLVSLLDIRTLPEFFDILYYWLSTKEQTSSYTDVYRDSLGNDYVDAYGCASFYRNTTKSQLDDSVSLDPQCFRPEAMAALEDHYRALTDRGVTVYVGHACVNLDAITVEERDSVEKMDGLFRETFHAMEGVTVVGSMSDYLYRNSDFYDTNYHLLTAQAYTNTLQWMEDLTAQMVLDGLLQGERE